MNLIQLKKILKDNRTIRAKNALPSTDFESEKVPAFFTLSFTNVENGEIYYENFVAEKCVVNIILEFKEDRGQILGLTMSEALFYKAMISRFQKYHVIKTPQQSSESDKYFKVAWLARCPDVPCYLDHKSEKGAFDIIWIPQRKQQTENENEVYYFEYKWNCDTISVEQFNFARKYTHPKNKFFVVQLAAPVNWDNCTFLKKYPELG